MKYVVLITILILAGCAGGSHEPTRWVMPDIMFGVDVSADTK